MGPESLSQPGWRAHSINTIGLGSVSFWSWVHVTIFNFIHIPQLHKAVEGSGEGGIYLGGVSGICFYFLKQPHSPEVELQKT